MSHQTLSQEVRRPRVAEWKGMVSTFGRRQCLQHGTSGVQILQNLQVITNEMTRLNINILGIAEHWMLGQGRFTMQEGNVMLYAGKERGSRREGVGFILDKEATKSIIGYNPMSPRLITIRLKAHPINLTIIQVYAPT